MFDDFHNIFVVRNPNSTCTSKAVHMATTLLNMPDIPAVPLPDDRQILHRPVSIGPDNNRTTLYGGIDVDTVQTVLKSSIANIQDFFLSTCSETFQSVSPSSVNKTCKELRLEKEK